MAWDASDRIAAHFPQRRTLNLSKFVPDEPIFNSSTSFSSQHNANMALGALLSPIEEESVFAFDSAPLQVKVTVKLLDPVFKTLHYNRTYSSSPSFEPTARICRGLLRRIEHCSKELITRNDPQALDAELRQAPRFEISFQLKRDGFHGVWAERTFKSYQKHPVTSALAEDILCATHSIVCVFLKHHDEHFRWTNEPSHGSSHDALPTFKPSLSVAPDLSCVPRSRFIESTQAWEFVPGYTLELVFKSRNPSRRQVRITRALKVNSKQTTPLNIGQAEALLWQAYRTLEDALDSRRTAFEIEHAHCDGFEGGLDCGCQHFDEDALCVELRIINNLGPCYEHLHRDIRSRLQLFRHVCGNDCDDFMRGVHESFDQLREKTDARLDALNDFDFQITELVGHGWRIKNAARFTLDSKQKHSRRTIGALLDRIRTGIGDVLRGHDVAVRMMAHKRGHLVLDKALISRNHQSSPGPFAPTAPQDEQALFVAHLKVRIQADIDLVCKDTCSLSDIPDVPYHEHAIRPRSPPSRPFTPRRTVPDGMPLPGVGGDPANISHTTTSNTPPGSLGHFVQPPVPRSTPPTSLLMRVFPLVPAKYRGNKEHSSNTTPSGQDSAIAVDSASDRSVRDEVVSVASSISGMVRPVDDRTDEETAQDKVLSPAAEVFRRSELGDDDSSSSRSTCSSTPALTESEMATPEHSLLITPAQARPSLKIDGQSFNDFGHGEPSSPFAMATPDLSYHNYQAAKPSAEQGLLVPKTPVTSTTPGLDLVADGGPAVVPTGHLECTEALNGTDVNRALEGRANLPQADSASEMHTTLQPAGHKETSSDLGITHGPDLAGHSSDSSECDSSAPAQPSVSHQGWLEHCVKDNDEAGSAVQGSADYPGMVATVTACDSSDTSRTQIRLTDDAIARRESPERQSDPQAVLTGDGREQSHQDRPEATALVLADKDDMSTPVLPEPPEPSCSGESAMGRTDTTWMRDSSAEDELFRSKADYFEGEEDTHSEEVGRLSPVGDSHPAAPSLPDTGAAESRPTVPSSESGVWQLPETVSGPDNESKHHGPGSSDGAENNILPECSSPARQYFPSEVLDPVAGPALSEGGAVRDSGVQNGRNVAMLELKDALETIHNVTAPDRAAVPAPRTPTPNVFPGNASITRTPRQCDFVPISESPRHGISPTPAGLSSHFLLPSLPVFASIDSTANRSKASLQSSSSEWEDCVSEARQSSDSVDTIQQPPSLSEHAAGTEQPSSPKRLGTPTAGILGLHESRWADFGIRGALTGSHAFGRPSTAPMLSAEHTHGNAEPESCKAGLEGEETPRARPATPHRKSLHLLQHKKSISSIIFPGTHHGHQPGQQGKLLRLNRRESKELRAREKSNAKHKAKEHSKLGDVAVQRQENPMDAGRFPGAMMLITGLAIASSVVNRSSA